MSRRSGMRSRKSPVERKIEILTSAIDLSKEVGYSHITRDDVAKRAGVSYGLINHYFKSIDRLRKLVLKTAIDEEMVEIIAQGMVRKDPLAKRITSKMKERVILYLSK